MCKNILIGLVGEFVSKESERDKNEAMGSSQRCINA